MTKNFFSKHMKKSMALFFIGMAGCGKTTLLHRISLDLSLIKKSHFIINLDPATQNIPYLANIDIRDTINFKKVMKDYILGPNGAILTALNLFSTRFDQVLKIIQKKTNLIEFILIDTPGQIEIFTWSASGSIITESLSKNFPAIMFYVIDSARTINPITFVSNILYSCSILYKTRLPLIMILNKIDITSVDFLREWLSDNESFDRALEKENFFAGSFARSLSLTIDVFHKKIPFLNISASEGTGSSNILRYLFRIWKEFSNEFQSELENTLFSFLNRINLKLNKKMIKRKISKKKKNKCFNIINDKNREPKNFLKVYEYIALIHLENDKIYSIECI